MEIKEFALHDYSRARDIPVIVYLPKDFSANLSLVFFAPGYQTQEELIKSRAKFAYKQYEYLAKYFTSKNYAFISMQHDLPGDKDGIEFIDQSLPQDQAREDLWSRCYKSTLFVIEHLKAHFPSWNYNKFIMTGHSNGGDIAKYFSNNLTDLVSHLIILDGRRCPLKANLPIKTLMFEADDTIPDQGVIPDIGTKENPKRQAMEWTIVKPRNATHYGYNGSLINDELEKKVINTIDWFLLD
jgi:predicted esterase